MAYIPTATITWNNLSVSQAGDYTLSFRYSQAPGFFDLHDRPMGLMVDGQLITNTVHFFELNSWNTWSNSTITVHLNKGINTVELFADAALNGNPDGANPHLDSMTVSPVSLDAAPSITSQPTNQTVNAGQSVTFSVTATGAAPLTYQWQKLVNGNWVNISGATSPSLTINSAQASDAGQYWVVVSNDAGTVTSNSVSLTVNPVVTAPSITSQPTDQTVTAGNSATFTVSATGTTPLSYQWQKLVNGTWVNISGATAPTLTINSAQSSDAGQYWVVVSNSAGTATSNSVSLTVNPVVTAPSITSQPADQTVNVGDSATFSVTAAGTNPLSYQWQKLVNGTWVNISGANSSSYTISSAQTSDAGQYQVVVSNSAGTAVSSTASLTVNPVQVGQDIVVHLSEDAWQGDAQYTISVDGVQVGGVRTETALHGQGQSEAVTLTGYSAGPHTVTVTFINDAYDGTPDTDRNLYVDSIDFMGVTYPGAALYSNGSQDFQIGNTQSSQSVFIDAGGNAVGSFVADTGFSGGNTYSTGDAIDTSGVTNPAPQAVYQSERYGDFTYTIGGLTAGASYSVRLDFTEIYWNSAGQRLFNVAINGNQVLSNFDIFATAGGKDIAIAESFNATVDSNGQIVIQFSTITDNAKVSGIEITPAATASGPIVLHLSEDAYQGDAQYTIAVDGVQVGGVRTATANHSQGQSEAVTLDGPYAAGSHTVTVTFLNDLWNGTPDTDRNLYVDGIDFLGTHFAGAALYSNGSVTFQLQVSL
jgi:type 1 glutamine amidotransferase